MKIYWALKSIPELSGFSHAERKQIWHRCWSKSDHYWQFWVAMGALILGFVLPYVAIMFFRPNLMSIKTIAVVGLVLGVIGSAFGILISNQIIIRSMLPTLRKQLPGFCSGCGYDLTGNVSGVCPECGVAVGKADDERR